MRFFKMPRLGRSKSFKINGNNSGFKIKRTKMSLPSLFKKQDRLQRMQELNLARHSLGQYQTKIASMNNIHSSKKAYEHIKSLLDPTKQKELSIDQIKQLREYLNINAERMEELTSAKNSLENYKNRIQIGNTNKTTTYERIQKLLDSKAIPIEEIKTLKQELNNKIKEHNKTYYEPTYSDLLIRSEPLTNEEKDFASKLTNKQKENIENILSLNTTESQNHALRILLQLQKPESKRLYPNYSDSEEKRIMRKNLELQKNEERTPEQKEKNLSQILNTLQKLSDKKEQNALSDPKQRDPIADEYLIKSAFLETIKNKPSDTIELPTIESFKKKSNIEFSEYIDKLLELQKIFKHYENK